MYNAVYIYNAPHSLLCTNISSLKYFVYLANMEDDFSMTARRSKSPDNSYASPWFLAVGDLSHEFYSTGKLRLPFRLGSWQFELLMTGHHFPNMLHCLENGLTGDVRSQATSLLQRKVKDRLLTRIGELGKSLESYRRVWVVPFDRTRDALLEIQPERIIGGNWALPTLVPDLPSVSWKEIQVVAPIGPDRYKVKIQRDVFECYTPRHADLFSKEIHLWRRIMDHAEIFQIRAPILRGLVKTDRNAPGIRGVLYDWIEPWTQARTLAEVNVRQVSRFRRELWYSQIERTIRDVQKLGLRCTERRLFWSLDVAQRVVIDSDLNANFSIIAFGQWKPGTDESSLAELHGMWKLETNPAPDFAFLDILRDFLQLGPRHIALNRSSTSAPPSFEALPSDLRNMIYEYTLVENGPIVYRYGGFFRRTPRKSKLLTSSTSCEQPIIGSALFCVSRSTRQESMSFFASKNRFDMEAIEICNFLRYLGNFVEYIKRMTITVVLSDDSAFSRAQQIGITELREKAKSLCRVDVVVRNMGGDFLEEQLLIRALQGLRGLQHFEISPRSRGLTVTERKEMQERIRREVLQRSSAV